MSMLQPVGFDRQMPVVSGVEISFVPMGHLLGSAAVRSLRRGMRLLLSLQETVLAENTF
jgi:Cft2 family RNA processing exonuclease